MNEKNWYTLNPGDIVQNLGSGKAYMIIDYRNGEYMLLDVVFASNPSEWELVKKGLFHGEIADGE